MVFLVHESQDLLAEFVLPQGKTGSLWMPLFRMRSFRLPLLDPTCFHRECLLESPGPRERADQLMNPVTMQDPEEILKFLEDISLKGPGFTTDCLLDYVLDEGFTEPIYLNTSGEDPEAFYRGQPNAWAVYQVREWKRVLTISGGPGKERRVQIRETP